MILFEFRRLRETKGTKKKEKRNKTREGDREREKSELTVGEGSDGCATGTIVIRQRSY